MGGYLITESGTYILGDTPEVDDLVCLLTEVGATRTDEPLQMLSRQQLVTQLGRGIPAELKAGNVVAGDPEAGGFRCWWPWVAQQYLAGVEAAAVDALATVEPPNEANAEDSQSVPNTESGPSDDSWPIRSRQWEDVEYSGVDRLVLIATTRGVVKPAGLVVAPPLRQPADLGKLATSQDWGKRPDSPRPQIWITGEAMELLDFPTEGLTKETIADVVGDFFGATITYSKSGFFTCGFPRAEDPDKVLEVEVILMPAAHLDPSESRPDDRGILGIIDKTLLPDDEIEAAHLLADRLQWLYGIENVLPAPRWTQVGVQLAEISIKKSRPKPKNSTTPPALVACPMPKEIGKLPGQWWTDKSWRPRSQHRRGDEVYVEIDQQAAYLPSVGGVYLPYGTPTWVHPDLSSFNEQQPVQGVFQVTVPAGNDLDIFKKLPIPHPSMSWTDESTFWATTADIVQLIAPVGNGGAGLAIAEIEAQAAYVWPEQHQWLKGFAELLRRKLVEARAAGRIDEVEMLQAIYKSYLGRLSAEGDTAFTYPYLHHMQPVWRAITEAITRWRALRHAAKVATDYDLYPMEVMVDAWFYSVPADFNVTLLESGLQKDGTRNNGGYRIKRLDKVA